MELRINPTYPSPGWLAGKGWHVELGSKSYKYKTTWVPTVLLEADFSHQVRFFLPRKRISCVLLLKALCLSHSLYIPSAHWMSAGTLETCALSLAMLGAMSSSAIIWKGSSHMDSWCWFSVYDVWLHLEISHINFLVASPLLSLLAKTVCTLISFTPHSNTMRNVIMISLYKQAHQNFNYQPFAQCVTVCQQKAKVQHKEFHSPVFLSEMKTIILPLLHREKQREITQQWNKIMWNNHISHLFI